MTNERVHHEYLGDGLYASFDGYYICISAGSHENDPVAYLDPDVIKALQSYIAKIYKLRPSPVLSRLKTIMYNLLSSEELTAEEHAAIVEQAVASVGGWAQFEQSLQQGVLNGYSEEQQLTFLEEFCKTLLKSTDPQWPQDV